MKFLAIAERYLPIPQQHRVSGCPQPLLHISLWQIATPHMEQTGFDAGSSGDCVNLEKDLSAQPIEPDTLPGSPSESLAGDVGIVGEIAT